MIEPTMDNVKRQFRHHEDGVNAIRRLTRDWCANYGIAYSDPFEGDVKAEQWTGERIGALIDAMAATPRADGGANTMHTASRPRFNDGPITVLRIDGKEAQLDGRRRSNLWRHQEGEFPVLVIEVKR